MAGLGKDRDAWTKYVEGLNPGERKRISALASEVAPVVEHREAKFGNVKVQVNGYSFDSKAEAARYQELRFMEQAGKIADIEFQPVFPLLIMELWRSQMEIRITPVGVFTADFRYVDLGMYARGEVVVEDVKSEATKTTAYRLRKRIAEAVHGVVIREVTK